MIYYALLLPALWIAMAVASHAWHHVKFAMIRRLPAPRPPSSQE